MTPDQLAYLERKRQDLYDIKAKLRQYRIKRSKSLTCAIDEVDSQLRFYWDWDEALRYDGMDTDDRAIAFIHMAAQQAMLNCIEDHFWGKPQNTDPSFGLEYFLRQEIKP